MADTSEESKSFISRVSLWKSPERIRVEMMVMVGVKSVRGVRLGGLGGAGGGGGVDKETQSP